MKVNDVIKNDKNPEGAWEISKVTASGFVLIGRRGTRVLSKSEATADWSIEVWEMG